MQEHSLYLHIPFCRHRCSYCDFNTYAGLENLIPDYVSALCLEIELLAASAGEKLPVHTVFFGGGTPSLLPASELERILRALESSFHLQPGLELTLEANPGTLNLSYLKTLHGWGFNRLSLGMQSAQPGELHLLERQHSFNDVHKSVHWARAAGFHNISLDLIFGLPFQTLDDWKNTLERALRLRPDHFSLYALTIEHGTPMQSWVAKGMLPEPNPDVAADMYEHSSERLEDAGYYQYEISNWARKNTNGDLLACRHNLQYWRNLPYLGFGAGAHGYARSVRTANVLAPAAYIRRCAHGKLQVFPRTPATAEARQVDRETEIGETMMMGLRLTEEGISNSIFSQRFHATLTDIFAEQIDRLLALELLEWTGEQDEILRLTPRGRLLGNQVFMEFI